MGGFPHWRVVFPTGESFDDVATIQIPLHTKVLNEDTSFSTTELAGHIPTHCWQVGQFGSCELIQAPNSGEHLSINAFGYMG